MQAIILAAGMGKRLRELTQNNTKCMVKVNGETLIERMLHQLDKHRLTSIVIVVGYEGQKLKDYISDLKIKTPITYIDNPIYNKTNNIYSLSLAKEYLLKEDTLLFESDIIFEDSVLDELIRDSRDTLALVDQYESWMDGTCVRLSDDDRITEFISGKNFDFKNTMGCYKTVNIYKFSKHFCETYYVPFLNAYQKALGFNEYYEQVLRVITMVDDTEIRGKRIHGKRWYEIDDVQDLDIASSIFCPDGDMKVSMIEKRYGGYWRYPNVLDFCYLVNPFYPPTKLIDEIKASFETLVTQYPSGMKVNVLLAARNFGINEENIIVGNGAAELIKMLMEQISGITGFICPTFEEYPNRYSKEDSIIYRPNNIDYSYTVKEIIEFFDRKEINNLVVINPDNPSGNYITKSDMYQLIDWCRRSQITLIIDESFIDFSDEEDATLIRQDIIDKNPNLVIVKSISKSYGVPGLRLGVLVSGNNGWIEQMKRDAAIWNINSFAEFYMQIEQKYKKNYEEGLRLFRTERNRFIEELSKIRNLRIVPTQANYVMVEVTGGLTSKELTKDLLLKYGILIKDLSRKIKEKQYIRIAIRNTEDNNRLIRVLHKEMKIEAD